MSAMISRPDDSVWVNAFASGDHPGKIVLYVQQGDGLYLTADEAEVFAEGLLLEVAIARSKHGD